MKKFCLTFHSVKRRPVTFDYDHLLKHYRHVTKDKETVALEKIIENLGKLGVEVKAV